MRRHRHYEALLARSAELSGEERDDLLAHLAACVRCQGEAAAFRRQDHAVRHYAAAQEHVSIDAAVLGRIRTEPPAESPPPPRHLRLGALAAGFVLAASVLLALGVTVGQRILPATPSPTSVALRGNCAADGADWVLKGPCQILGSPEAFRHPGVTFYPLALQWAKKHLQQPHYVVRKNAHFPVVVNHGSPVYFSEIAVDQQAHVSMYVVGNK